jgi:hypothetical protein
MRRLTRLLRPLWLPAAWLISRFWVWLERRPVPSPAVRQALAAAEREGLTGHDAWMFPTLARLARWLGGHRAQVVASFELVFAAVQEAETYFSLTGPEKKAYARELVYAVLDELGWEERTGLLFAVANSLIGSSIDATVFLFHKRGVFERRSSDAYTEARTDPSN